VSLPERDVVGGAATPAKCELIGQENPLTQCQGNCLLTSTPNWWGSENWKKKMENYRLFYTSGYNNKDKKKEPVCSRFLRNVTLDGGYVCFVFTIIQANFCMSRVCSKKTYGITARNLRRRCFLLSIETTTNWVLDTSEKRNSRVKYGW
jgi:hypothetical protein